MWLRVFLFAMLLLPATLAFGTLGGIATGFVIEGLPFHGLWGLTPVLLKIMPCSIAGLIAGSLPILTLKFFYPDARFGIVASLQVALMLFAILLMALLGSHLLRLVSLDLAQQVPGFAFGAGLAVSVTKAGAQIGRLKLRLILLAAFTAWLALGAPYLWSLAPLPGPCSGDHPAVACSIQ